MIERLSLELHDRCGKACRFCYNASGPSGSVAWDPADVIRLVQDCARNGVLAVSLGGGEPLEYPGLFTVLDALRGTLYRSLTSNGLLLDSDETLLPRLIASAPDRVHLSIHAPGNSVEVARVIRQVLALETAGIPSGVNLLVSAAHLADATASARQLHLAGIDNTRIVYLPMRGRDTPSPAEVAAVAAAAPHRPFQSMTCLAACGPSPRFASLDSQRRVAWCSYTRARRPISSLTHAALLTAMHELPLESCDERTGSGLVGLRLR